MKKQLLLLLILVSAGFSAVTLEQAQTTVTPYFLSGEQLDIQPSDLTTSGSSSYWVLEAKSLNQIQVMFPVDANTGNIETSSSIKEVLKTHYLANFLVTDTTITDYLDSQLTYAQQRGDAFSSAKTDLEFYETQLGNITITSLSPLKSALSTGNSEATALRQQILSTKTTLGNVKSPGDVASAQGSLSSFFSKEGAFLSQSETVSSKASDFMIELAGNDELKTNRPDLLQALQGVVNSYSLRQSVTAQKDDLTLNKATIDAFFAGLDGKADDYYLKLTNRIEQSGNIGAINAIIENVNAYQANYTAIGNDATAKRVPDDYNDFAAKMDELHALINESYAYCNAGTLAECQKAEANFDDMDSLVTSLKSIVTSYSTACTNGATRACTGGTQTCANGVWGSCKTSGGFNWTLIIIMVIVIAGLVAFKFKDKILPEKPATSQPTDWQTQQYKF